MPVRLLYIYIHIYIYIYIHIYMDTDGDTHTHTHTGGDTTGGTKSPLVVVDSSPLDSSTGSPAGNSMVRAYGTGRRDAGAGGDLATVGGGAGGAGPGEIEVKGREGGREWKGGRGSG